MPVDVEFIKKQIDLVLEEEKVVYAKTGMLYSPEIIKAIANKVKEHDLKLVVDPVMIAGSGGLLSKNNIAQSLKKDLLLIFVILIEAPNRDRFRAKRRISHYNKSRRSIQNNKYKSACITARFSNLTFLLL